MEWLICVSDHIVEFIPSWQTFPDGRRLEVLIFLVLISIQNHIFFLLVGMLELYNFVSCQKSPKNKIKIELWNLPFLHLK